MLVREPAPLERLATESLPELRDLGFPRRAALPLQPLDERGIGVKEAVALEWRRLVRRFCSRDRHERIVPVWVIDV